MKRIPSTLKYLLTSIVLLSLVVAVFDKLALTLFSGTGLFALLGLSWSGLDNYFYWQFLTQFLIEPSVDGLSFSFLLNLFFDCYLFWMIGASLISKVGEKSFLRLTLLTGISSGLFGLALLSMTHSHGLIIGLSPLLYGLLIAWIAHFPHFDFLLFISMKVKAKWCVFAMIGIGLLSALSEGRFIDFGVALFATLFGYLYTTLVFGLKGPFNFTSSLDKHLASFGKWCRQKARRGKPEVVHGKIIDIRTLHE